MHELIEREAKPAPDSALLWEVARNNASTIGHHNVLRKGFAQPLESTQGGEP